MKPSALFLAALCLLFAGFTSAATAETLTVTIHELSSAGVGKAIGAVTLEETRFGLLLKPNLAGLSPGAHGFHIHENPSCAPGEKEGKMVAGLAAGGHYDPAKTGSHQGPYGYGHLGDLPVLVVDADGRASLPVLAPRLTLDEVRNRSLMIHAGGDNYADQPKKLGGGGSRAACGVIR